MACVKRGESNKSKQLYILEAYHIAQVAFLCHKLNTTHNMGKKVMENLIKIQHMKTY